MQTCFKHNFVGLILSAAVSREHPTRKENQRHVQSQNISYIDVYSAG